MDEVTDEPLHRDRVCGVDIGKRGLAATIRVPSETTPGRRMAGTRLFPVTKAGVLAVADWMRCWQVPAAAMEATSDYWKPVYYRLEGAGVRISAVLSDLFGVTGRDIMDRLIAGERDPKALAQLARKAARKKIPELEQALEGAEFFTARHAALLQMMLERTDRITADIDQLTAKIEDLLA